MKPIIGSPIWFTLGSSFQKGEVRKLKKFSIDLRKHITNNILIENLKNRNIISLSCYFADKHHLPGSSGSMALSAENTVLRTWRECCDGLVIFLKDMAGGTSIHCDCCAQSYIDSILSPPHFPHITPS